MLQAIQIAAGYGERPILREVSLTIERGALTALLGPNGSGKTTLVRVLARVLRPHSGQCLLEGQPFDQISPVRFAQQVAYAPQESPPDMGFTVAELVMMGRYPHQKGFWGVSARDWEAVHRAMEFAGIAHLATRRVGELSGGERQRIHLARALAQQANYLLLDEPTAHLDLRHQVQILHAIRQHALEQQKGVLAVLHDLNLASEYADYVALMHEGQIVAYGTPEAVFDPAILESVYHTPTLVRRNPLTGKPLVFALTPQTPLTLEPNAPCAFVIAGGGTGAELYYALLEQGWRVCTGVLNLLDTDEEIARALQLEHLTEPPFSPISEPNFQRACQLARGAHAVVIADVPFGHGNLRNLEVALHAQQAGVPVYALCERPFEKRDYTHGQATALWNQLLQGGMRCFDNLKALMETLADASPPEEGDEASQKG